MYVGVASEQSRDERVTFHGFKATICNFDHNPLLQKTKLNDAC